MQYICVGIDVSKQSLDLATDPAAVTRQFINDPHGHAAIVKHLQGLGDIKRIVLEATGGYERALVATLLTAENNRLKQAHSRDVQASIQQVVTLLEKADQEHRR